MSPSNGSQLQSSSPTSLYNYNMLEKGQIFLHQGEKIWQAAYGRIWPLDRSLPMSILSHFHVKEQ